MKNKPNGSEILMKRLSEADINISSFIDLIIADSAAREFIIDELLNNNHISVYYNCHLIIVKATEINPELFYGYWKDFATLLCHKNSYHRNYGLMILANLIPVDKNNLFKKSFPDYFKLLYDEKFTTTKCCIECSKKIITAKPEYADEIFNCLLDFIEHYKANVKRQNLLRKTILSVYNDVSEVLIISRRTENRIENFSNYKKKH